MLHHPFKNTLAKLNRTGRLTREKGMTPTFVGTMKTPSRKIRTPPVNIGLLELIRTKREWCWKPSPLDLKRGFRGWYQRGYLPHFDAPGVTQFVTFLLEDSFPPERRPEWENLLKQADDSTRRRKIESWLDRGHGQCWLRRHEVAAVVEAELIEGNEVDYRMQAWVIMPNHVHLVVDVWDVPLAKLLQRWKGRTSRRANMRIGRYGSFWQEDYHDTLIRDEAHLTRAIRYTEQNPVKARLIDVARRWPWSSSRHRDEYQRLPWHRSEEGVCHVQEYR